jgi:biopolymer transport protein ExbD
MATINAPRDDATMAEINVAPFTGLLLVLLVVFVLLKSVVTPAGFQRELPGCGCMHMHIAKGSPIRISANVDGRLFVNGVPTDVEKIYPLLRQLAQERGRPHVSVTADTDVDYGVIIRILDATRSAGLGDVGFVTS